MEDDEQYILHLISEGVNGYLLKNADPDEMEKAILKVVEKGYYFSDNISMLVLQNLKKLEKTDTIFNPDFTERELQVLELICREYSNSEIAENMNISIRTAEGYRQKLIDKSGAKNIAGLVILALKYNWVSLK
jgi:DNA-binding NarL/FixJ family response regulator